MSVSILIVCNMHFLALKQYHIKMKAKAIILSLILITGLGFVSCDLDNSSPEKQVEQFKKELGIVMDTTADFLLISVEYESANFANMSNDEVYNITVKYLQSVDDFAVKMEALIAGKGKTLKHESLKVAEYCESVVAGVFGISGLDPLTIKRLGDIIGETRTEAAAIAQAHKEGLITDAQYKQRMDELRINNPMRVVNMGIAGSLGAGATYGAALIITAPTWPALAAIGAIGGTVAYGSYRLLNWYTSKNKSGDDITIFSIIEGYGLNDPFPATLLPPGSNMAILVDGQPPVLLENFRYPQQGNEMLIEIDFAGYSVKGEAAVQPGYSVKSASSNVQVCYYQQPSSGTNCDMVAFVTGHPVPSNPQPYQSVTVVGSLLPATPNCQVHFSIIGTDGYSNSGTRTSNASGVATFNIPGAQPGVMDRVTITASNGVTYTVVYYFGGGKDEGPVRLDDSRRQ